MTQYIVPKGSTDVRSPDQFSSVLAGHCKSCGGDTSRVVSTKMKGSGATETLTYLAHNEVPAKAHPAKDNLSVTGVPEQQRRTYK